jgi:hypothetical protein
MSIVPIFSPGATSPESRDYYPLGGQSKDQQRALQTAIFAANIPLDTELPGPVGKEVSGQLQKAFDYHDLALNVESGSRGAAERIGDARDALSRVE